MTLTSTMKQQAPPHSKSKQSRTKPPLRIKELKSLLAEAQLSIEKAKVDLRRAGDVARRAGLNVESTLGTANISSRLSNNNHSEATAASASASKNSNTAGTTTEATTTGGHSNTDHVVVLQEHKDRAPSHAFPRMGSRRPAQR